jgi:hypothetical protein
MVLHYSRILLWLHSTLLPPPSFFLKGKQWEESHFNFYIKLSVIYKDRAKKKSKKKKMMMTKTKNYT